MLIIIDTCFYGSIMGVLSLASFLITVGVTNTGGVGLSNIPNGCNHVTDINETGCDFIFRGRAVAFYCHSILLLIHGFNCRHMRTSIFTFVQRKDTNRYLWYSALVGLVFIIPTAYFGRTASIVVLLQLPFG